MGLEGGENGAKAVLRRECASAFKEVANLEGVRELFGVERSQTLAILDGNVILRGLPSGVETLDETVDFYAWKIVAALRSAVAVCVVFDDASVITRAKSAEQAKRDAAARKRVPICSDDLTPFVVPETDDYTLDDMLHPQFSAQHLVANCREARPRFVDAIAQGVMGKVASLQREAYSLAFDGVDPRGASRDASSPRVGGVLANEDVWENILARVTPLGEGDLKMTSVCQNVRDAVEVGEGGSMANVCLYQVVTIDTDSLMIEAIEQSRRIKRVAESGVSEFVVLCFSERARKRKNEDWITAAHVLACDIGVLHDALVQRMFGTVHLSPSAAARVPDAFLLLAASVALCGCDFTRLHGMRADKALEVVGQMVRHSGGTRDIGWVRGSSAQDALKAVAAVERFVLAYCESLETNSRMTRSRNSASAYQSQHLKKAVWTAAYWSGVEHKTIALFGY
mgnify:CR=1 FL=1